MNELQLNQDVHEGIHSFAKEKIDEYFNEPQQRIVNVFKTFWYVTKADRISIGNSEYEYILIKAPQFLANLLNIYVEIIVVFSDYAEFEPRTFDAFDNIKSKLESGRVENLCGVLVSKDNNVEKLVGEFTSGKEIMSIIAFSYEEIITNRDDSYIFRNKFKKVFYNRDLFAFEDALKTDLFFFGRNDIVMKIINDHLNGKNIGVFGLRKTGKTSILYDVKRKISQKSAKAVLVSCQNPAMSSGSWVDAIFYIVKAIYDCCDMRDSCPARESYTEVSAADKLSETIRNLCNSNGYTLLLMLDEIEHITYKKAAEECWKTGMESVKFWKAMRAAYLDEHSNFTYCIVGTNPICIEYATIDNTDNPIFNGVGVSYISGFEVDQTRAMVRKLGRIMGVKFDEVLYSKMVEDYGGHPFLIRPFCSFLTKKYGDRPLAVDRRKYAETKKDFDETQGKYFDMILEVLEEFYPDEYELLKYLAQDDEKAFLLFVEDEPAMIQHLIGYGIINKNDDYYDFKMDVVKEYILRKEKVSKKRLSREEKWSHFSAERGRIESKLRKMVKSILLMTVYKGDKESAKQYVMKKIHNSDAERKKYGWCTYEDLFNPDKSNIFWNDLTTLVIGKWEDFSPFMMGVNQDEFHECMNILNRLRADAHAKTVSDNDVAVFDGMIGKLSRVIKSYNDLFK